MARKIKALRRITDGGHMIRRGQTADVADAYAAEWIARGWAVEERPKPKPEKPAE